MKFQKIELHEVRIPFRFSFKHALADRKEAHSVILCLHGDNGITGWGECVPREYLTGEDVGSVIDSLRSLWWPAIREIDFPDGQNPAELLKPIFQEASSKRLSASYAGIDIAIYDALSRECGKPLADLLQWQKPTVHLTAPLGGSSFMNVKKKLRWFKFLGFKQFKIKLGMNMDRQICLAAEPLLHEGLDLRADSNAAWSQEKALKILASLKNFPISSYEQPVATLEEMAELNKRLPYLFMADESLCSLDDAKQSLELGACGMWNLRLAKIGGFTGLMEFVKLAQEHDIKLHLGTLVGETSLLAAAGRIATGIAECKHVEYGFPRLFLKGDPFRGGPGGYLGTGLPQCANPGLGIITNQKALDKITINRISLT